MGGIGENLWSCRSYSKCKRLACGIIEITGNRAVNGADAVADYSRPSTVDLI